MRQENNFNWHKIEKPPKINNANMSVLKSPNVDAANIISVLQ